MKTQPDDHDDELEQELRASQRFNDRLLYGGLTFLAIVVLGTFGVGQYQLYLVLEAFLACRS